MNLGERRRPLTRCARGLIYLCNFARAYPLTRAGRPIAVEASPEGERRWRSELAPRLVRRTESQRFDVHPGELRYLLEDPAFVRTGISAASEYGLDLLSGHEADGYVVASVLKRLIADHALSVADAHSGNVRVRLVPDKAWRHLADAKVAPTAAVAIDLAEDPDPRSASAGKQMLRRLKRH